MLDTQGNLTVDRAVFYAAADATFREIARRQVEMRNRPSDTPPFDVAERDNITAIEIRSMLDRLELALGKWQTHALQVIASDRPAGRFNVGDRVLVARVLDGMTAPDLIGRTGVVIEAEQVSHQQRNYEVRLDGNTCDSYLNDQMLEREPAQHDS